MSVPMPSPPKGSSLHPARWRRSVGEVERAPRRTRPPRRVAGAGSGVLGPRSFPRRAMWRMLGDVPPEHHCSNLHPQTPKGRRTMATDDKVLICLNHGAEDAESVLIAYLVGVESVRAKKDV